MVVKQRGKEEPPRFKGVVHLPPWALDLPFYFFHVCNVYNVYNVYSVFNVYNVYNVYSVFNVYNVYNLCKSLIVLLQCLHTL